MKLHPVYQIIILAILLACIAAAFLTIQYQEVKFKISNNSGHTIDSLMLSNGTDRYKEYKIQPGEIIEDKLVFSNTVKSDGQYFVESYYKGQKQATGFGYFTNGSPTGNLHIEIENDSIVANEVSGYY